MNCNRKDCKKLAVWHPKIIAWAKGYSKETHSPADMTISMGLCDAHMDEMTIEELLSPQGLAAINQMLDQAGRVHIDASTAKIDRVKIKNHDSGNPNWKPGPLRTH